MRIKTGKEGSARRFAVMIVIALILAVTFAIYVYGFKFSTQYTEGIYAYYTSTNPTLPKYMTWNGTDNSSELSALEVNGNIQSVILESANTRMEKLAGYLTDTGVVNVQVWDGTVWSNSTNMTTSIGTTNDAYRGFDIAYETVSGRAVIAYDNGTQTPAYRIWNGTHFSAEGSLLADGCTGIAVWVVMVSHPTTNEVLEIDLDTNGDFCSQVWNGTAWTNNKTISAAGTNYATKMFDIEYESSSGDGIVVFQGAVDGQMEYCTLTSGTWCAAPLNASTDFGSVIEWVDLARMTSTDRLMMSMNEFGTSTDDINMMEWNGTAWGTGVSIDATAEKQGVGSVSPAYIGTTGNCLMVYVDKDSDYPSYATCTGAANCFAGTWSAPTNTTSTANNCGEARDLDFIKLTSNPFDNRIMMTAVSQTNGYKCSQEYNGTVWGTWRSNMGMRGSTPIRRDFDFAYDAFKDFTAPNVSLVAPANNTKTSNTTNVFYYNVTDVSSIANCSLILNGVLNNTNTTPIMRDTTLNFTLINMTYGQYNWSVNCTDIYENTGASGRYNLTVESAFVPSVSFTLTLPGESPVVSNQTQNGTTAVMFFNSSSNTNYDMDPCVKATGTCQNSTVPFFVFENTGNVNLSWTVSLNATLPSEIALQANNQYNGTNATNITTSKYNLSASVAPANQSNAYFFADFVNAYPDNSSNRTLTHEGSNLDV